MCPLNKTLNGDFSVESTERYIYVHLPMSLSYGLTYILAAFDTIDRAFPLSCLRDMHRIGLTYPIEQRNVNS